MKHLILVGALVLVATDLLHGQANSLKSPDGQLVMTFSLDSSGPMSTEGSGRLQYAVTYHGKPIIDASALGLDLDDKMPLGENVKIRDTKESNGIDDYPLLFSKVSHVHDAYNSMSITVQEASDNSGRGLTVEARAYNSGIAFRYLLPVRGGSSDLHLRDEETEFRFSQDDTAWVLALPNYRSSYESEYMRYNLSALSNQGGVSSKF